MILKVAGYTLKNTVICTRIHALIAHWTTSFYTLVFEPGLHTCIYMSLYTSLIRTNVSLLLY